MLKKNILLLSHHFWPENFLINSIALELKKLGCRVTVITGMPNYPLGEIYEKYRKFKKVHIENFKGIKIYRIPIYPRKNGSLINLCLNYLSFLISGFFFIKKTNLNNEIDHIFSYATSPITSSLIGIILKKKYKKKLSLWVQDLWPESVISTGFVKNKIIIYLISLIVKYIYNQSDNIIAQSQAFKKNIKQYTNKKIHVVENSHFNINGFKFIKINKSLDKILKSKFCITFAGNIGKAQSYETIINTAKVLEKIKKIHFLIIGSGSEFAKMSGSIKQNNLNNITLLGSMDSNKTLNILKRSSALLLTLKKSNIFSLTIPNKFQTYLYAKKPLLVSADGEVSRMTKKYAVGLTSPSENYQVLSKNIIKLYKGNNTVIDKYKSNCEKLYNEKFNIKNQAQKLFNFFI